MEILLAVFPWTLVITTIGTAINFGISWSERRKSESVVEPLTNITEHVPLLILGFLAFTWIDKK